MLICRCFDQLEHAEEFVNGKIRMMSLKYYQEKEADDNGRKDKFEGAQKLLQGDQTVIVIDGREITKANGLVSVVLHGVEHEKTTKICCCTALPVTDRIESIDSLSQFKLPYCVLFSDPNEFLFRFRNAAKGMHYATGKVTFYDESTYSGSLNEFMKPTSFEWQNEFRLTLWSDKEDPFYLDIGDMHGIAKIYKTEELVQALKEARIETNG